MHHVNGHAKASQTFLFFLRLDHEKHKGLFEIDTRVLHPFQSAQISNELYTEKHTSIFKVTWYSIWRMGVPDIYSHPFSRAFSTFSVTPDTSYAVASTLPIALYTQSSQAPWVRSFRAQRRLHSDQKQALSIATSSQPSKPLVSAQSFGLSAMHETMNQLLICVHEVQPRSNENDLISICMEIITSSV
jgi:hypothetical protein